MRKSKQDKLKALERRKKQLERYVKPLQKKEVDYSFSNPAKTFEKKKIKLAKESMTNEEKYLTRDLRNVLLTTGSLVILCFVIFFINIKTDFLAKLAESLLKGIVN